jgi:putative DNA primase/helicase
MRAEERRRHVREREKEVAQRVARQLSRVVKIASECIPVEYGQPVRNYVAARGIPASTMALAVAAGSLREHVDAQGRVSMIALAHDKLGRLRALQMTKLMPDGSGKRGDPARLTFGPLIGSACRLMQVQGDTLAVCEGTETALAFYTLRKIPTWSLFGVANLSAFTPPAGIRRLVIGADGDRAGLEAAERLFDRLRGRIRVIIAPAPDGLDWLDVLVARHV